MQPDKDSHGAPLIARLRVSRIEPDTPAEAAFHNRLAYMTRRPSKRQIREQAARAREEQS